MCLGFQTNCTYRPKEKRLTQFKNNDGKILTSFYRQNNDTIEFKRIVAYTSSITVQSGQIFLGEYALTHQRFKTAEKFNHDSRTIDSLTSQIVNEGLVTTLLEEREVMFIQIVPDSTMDNLDALGFLNLRQKIEGQIDEKLQINNLGEWFAGDLGAGANMLFFIDDWDKSMGTVIEVLRKENLLDHVLIAKRIMTSAEDWSYEIVYPIEYEGVFNPLTSD